MISRSFRLIILTTFILFVVSAMSARLVTIGIYENAPKIFTNEFGKPSGIFVDIIEKIASSEDWGLQYVNVTWDEGLRLLSEGELDLMPDVAYTNERNELFSFHEVPILSSWSQVFASKGSRIGSILDLEGKRVSVLEGSVHQTALLELVQGFALDIELTAYEDFEKTFSVIAEGKADATVINYYYGVLYADDYGLQYTPIVFNPSKLYFATAKGENQELLLAIDRHIREMKSDYQSVYYQTLKTWTGEEVLYRLPDWLKTTLAVILLILIMSTISTIVLKQQVNLRTAELQAANREMEKRIDQRTADLAIAMEEAKSADRLKSAFLATMSHELRTPLNSIIGFTGMILQELAGPINDEQRKQLGMVKKSSQHLLSLINDVLDISKIEAGEMNIEYENFNLKESIEKLIAMVAQDARKKGLSIETKISSEVGGIYSDRRRIEQIVLNLLSNAVKFTEKGKITVSCRIVGNDCHLSVEDSGIGIDKDNLKDLFDPFSQIDTGLTRKYEGTGLGLSICKKLLDLMGGHIFVESKIGEGSEFSITFPVSME
jgi:signal transduction histidine kinase